MNSRLPGVFPTNDPVIRLMATRNPVNSPVEVDSLSVYPGIYRVLAPSQVVGNRISEPSTVAWMLEIIWTPIQGCFGVSKSTPFLKSLIWKHFGKHVGVFFRTKETSASTSQHFSSDVSMFLPENVKKTLNPSKNQWIFQVLVIGGRDYITP